MSSLLRFSFSDQIEDGGRISTWRQVGADSVQTKRECATDRGEIRIDAYFISTPR